ncbi:SusC/RagA family TonB-linked outer membrane protein [Algibacter mikhailovii]|uniref:SusC/RagA family TonB-linked outer membrane protein n=1 Tax=Algibacter mikhailovii TaxID=425498 RepID=A0A918R4W4_9FLAO|nr:TonB-dependent receptor [Algibacter mikhailovii]GGZ83496.1 SusC/RagA family TonB-linked outer membrane protein [Algibacter mikhailovii]
MRIKCLNNEIWRFTSLKSLCVAKLFLVYLIALPVYAGTSNTRTSLAIENPVQQIITGVVSDADGPLPGVNIIIKGTTTGTQTDFDGNFAIEADNSSVLVFSYIGYKSQEITVGNNTTLNVVLEADIAGLEEVVVVGYTTRKRGEVTGSVSTVSAEAIQTTGNKDVAKSLSGKVSGLIVADRGGYPGSNDNADITLLIRGVSTINNNQPLILIDGVPSGSFNQLAPQDIESLSVLKDGAAAIYGTRAANGVILITTRRGKLGKPKISFSTQYSITDFSRFPNQMTSEQNAIYENEIAERAGTAPPFSQDDINKFADGSDPINYPNTRWADLTFSSTAPETRHSLSISGGSENVNYFVSGDALSQTGMYHSGDLNYKQYQLRSNIDIRMFEDFKIGVDITGLVGRQNEPGVDRGTIYKHIYTNRPDEVGLYPNGLPGFGGENGQNPYIMSTTQSGFVRRDRTNVRARFPFNWDLNRHIKGLSLRGYASVGKNSTETKNWDTPWTYYQLINDEYVPAQGFQTSADRVLSDTYFTSNQTLLNATLHYKTTLGENHNISAFAGVEQNTTKNSTFFGRRQGFKFDTVQVLDAGPTEGQTNGGSAVDFAFQSYFGSLSYDYNKKYFVDLTIRRDGSNRFAEGYQYGTFPGVAVSWAIDKESFMENVEWVNALKLRSSWSRMGNDRIPLYSWLGSYDFGYPSNPQNQGWYLPNGYTFGTPGTPTDGYARGIPPNPDVTWETADMMNIGLNFTLFDSKLSGDLNYFYQKRTDILVPNSGVPDVTGLTRPGLPNENLGEVDSYGWEFELSWRDQIGSVDYNIGANFTNAQNEVINFGGESENIPDYRKRKGKQVNSYIVFPTNGLFRDQAQVDAAPAKKDGTVEGEPYYVDTNGDGAIDADDRIRIDESAIPEIQYGVFGGLNVKNWNFSFLFQGQAKASALVFFDQSGTKPDFVFNERWTPDNRNASYPRAFGQGDTYSGQQNTGPQGVNSGFEGADFYYRDASFVRLKEIELGYTISRDVLKFADLKLFARGFNLLTMFSDIYDLGLDPEATGYNNFRNSAYPSLKSVTVGLNLNF